MSANNLKRKAAPEEDDQPLKKVATVHSDDEDSDDGLQEIIDVDFDFYNPDEIDFHALKKLLKQLFSSDAELINLGDLADILIEENHVGTTVKVDDQQSDPYGILSVINLQAQKSKQGVSQLCQYLLGKCPKKNEKLSLVVDSILNREQVGWVVSERFVNMPVEIMPPMYAMLQEETKKAVEQSEPYKFEWYMFISKTYKEVNSTADEENEETAQKLANDETFYFQSEDEIIAKYAEHQFDFKFTNSDKEQAADSRRAFSDFGIEPARKLLFVHHSKFDSLVEEITKTCTSTQQ
ncbi:p21-C-terminal region-binding protein-domain-containing protein [Sporodiniella umbellata]|nr:p21-C-terminal region-binding protein-domain-containing protein [Sporodiniella umbellata]